MTATTSPRADGRRGGRGGFLPLLHAEWTKFRTVRSWVTGMGVAALLMVLVALLAGASSDQKGAPPVPVGPGGEPVTDSYFLVHKPLTGDGSVTVAVSALRSNVPKGPGDLRPGVVPWAKAGLIVKESTRQGSSYAAVMVTGKHGVRMQDDYVNDTAGPPRAGLRRVPPMAAAGPLGHRGHRLRLQRRQALDRGGYRAGERARIDRAGGALRRLPARRRGTGYDGQCVDGRVHGPPAPGGADHRWWVER
ncbi:hypothetical protein [Streptomyces uncialis]|uniref:hypothetical protein n=1 Tax=Streptomyces uncialis TaxID=1048205 RepID=UPI0022585635|nr:hypothetical protein [Streptomyces uncialis]MCX4657744.1 hypothetical protein [Streptomyces uncialis]